MIVYVGRRAGKQEGAAVVLRADTAHRTAEPLKPRLDLRNHSPTGFGWGYAGSGPSQLALALLADAGNDRLALELYQRFKGEVIARLERNTPWVLPQRDIVAWLADPENYQFRLQPIEVEERVEVKLTEYRLSELPEHLRRTLRDAMRTTMLDAMAQSYGQLKDADSRPPFLLGPYWGAHPIAYQLPESELFDCPGCHARVACAYGPHAPTSGALAICGNCGALLEFRDDLGVRAAAAARLQEVNPAMRNVWAHARQRSDIHAVEDKP